MSGFFLELKRRNVFRVAVAYSVVGWLLIQVLELAAESFEAPAWVMKIIITIIVLGFFPTVFFSWAYEITPEGIKRESDVIRDASITHLTAKKLDVITIAAVLCIAVVLAWQMFFYEPSIPVIESEPAATSQTSRTEVVGKDLGEYSIAVLPFANRSKLDDNLFFSDGIHDDLLTQLSKIRGLKVTSRTSVMGYRDTVKKIPEIASELGVATILEGSVQRAGDRIRINAQLIDVDTDAHLWADTFDREMTVENLFDIQSEITRQITAAVRGQLTPEEDFSLAAAPTQNIAAYEAFLRAREMLNRDYSMDVYISAEAMVAQALTLDPDFALAYLLLAEIHGQAAWIGYDDSLQRRKAALAALNRAESLLGPDSPEVLAARGEYLYRFAQDYPAALNAQLKAHVGMPGNATLLEQIGLTQRRLGLWEDALDSFAQGAELDPVNASIAVLTTDTLLEMQEWSRLQQVLLPARKKFPDDVDLASTEVLFIVRATGDVKTARMRYDGIRPNSGESYIRITTALPWLEGDVNSVINAWNRPEVIKFTANAGWAGVRDLNLAMAHLHLEEPDQADQLLDQVVRSLIDLDRDRRSSTVAVELGTLALALALQGRKAQAVQIAEEATRTISPDDDSIEGIVPLKRLCQVLAINDERDRAIDLLDQLIDVPGGFVRWELYLDPRWDFFRDDSRFNDIIRPHDFNKLARAKETDPT